MKRTTKILLIHVAVAGGILWMGRFTMAQEAKSRLALPQWATPNPHAPMHDPAVTPESGLTPKGLASTGLRSTGPTSTGPASKGVASKGPTSTGLTAKGLSSTGLKSTAAWEPIAPGTIQPMPDDALGLPSSATSRVEIPWEDSGDTEFLVGDSTADFATAGVCEICGEGAAAPPLWYVRQDVRVLSLNTPYGILTSQLLLIDPDARFDPAMGTRSLAFDVSAGYSTTVGRHLGRDTENRDQFIEFSYWGMQKWDASHQQSATERITDDSSQPLPFEFGNLYSPFPATVRGFNRADQHILVQESKLNDYEVNIRLRPRGRADRMVLYPNGRWRRQCQPGSKLSYLFGMRVLTLDESFRFHSQGQLHVLNNTIDREILDRRPISADYFVRSHNDLLGLQIGFDYIFQECKWNWGFHGKTGPYVNFSDQISRIVTDAAGDDLGSVDLNERHVGKADDVAALIEFGVEGNYKIRPNVSLHASYDLMWMVGLSRAAEQLNFSLDNVAQLRNESVLFSHGLSLGVECLW